MRDQSIWKLFCDSLNLAAPAQLEVDYLDLYRRDAIVKQNVKRLRFVDISHTYPDQAWNFRACDNLICVPQPDDKIDIFDQERGVCIYTLKSGGKLTLDALIEAESGIDSLLAEFYKGEPDLPAFRDVFLNKLKTLAETIRNYHFSRLLSQLEREQNIDNIEKLLKTMKKKVRRHRWHFYLICSDSYSTVISMAASHRYIAAAHTTGFIDIWERGRGARVISLHYPAKDPATLEFLDNTIFILFKGKGLLKFNVDTLDSTLLKIPLLIVKKIASKKVVLATRDTVYFREIQKDFFWPIEGCLHILDFCFDESEQKMALIAKTVERRDVLFVYCVRDRNCPTLIYKQRIKKAKSIQWKHGYIWIEKIDSTWLRHSYSDQAANPFQPFTHLHAGIWINDKLYFYSPIDKRLHILSFIEIR